MQLSDPATNLRKLTRALIISGGINVFFVTFFIYWVFIERPPVPYYELKPAEKKEEQAPLAMNQGNAELLRRFRNFSREQLVAKLSDTQWVENGYTQRDLALACLVQNFYFDLPKALQQDLNTLQKRTLAYGRFQNGTLAEVLLFPGLNDGQYQKILEFAFKEKWPLTPQGLFLEVKKAISNKESPDPTLIDAFSLTPEYLATELLFNRSSAPLEKSEIILILSQGTWEMLSAFTESQRAVQDLSEARRQKFLVDWIDQGSRAAAYVLLKTDGRFAATKLDDAHVLNLLGLLKEKTDLAQMYALAVLKSPRGDAVLKVAAQRLYEYAGEQPPEQPLHSALVRFVPTVSSSSASSKPKSSPIGIPPIQPKPMAAKSKNQQKAQSCTFRYYVVQEGDSLWKISRMYKADLESIKKINQLQSDFLKPGTTLKIPVNIPK